MTITWNPLRIGAGGWITGGSISNDGATKICWADTYGAYLRNETTQEWEQLITQSRWPAADFGHDAMEWKGVFAGAVAPSDANRIYLVANGQVYKSTNRGSTFTRTAFTKVDADPNIGSTGGVKVRGPKMAVDPANPDVVYFGTYADGCWVTADGGANWSLIAAIPIVTNSTYSIAFDPASGTTGGKTNTIYVHPRGSQMYVSTDAGSTWAATTGGGTDPIHLAVGNSIVYETTTAGTFRKYSAGTWLTISGANSPHTVAVDPADSNRIIVADDAGRINQTLNGGSTWTGTYFPDNPPEANNGFPVGAGEHVATDIPWMAWTNEQFMSNGDMMFNPGASNELWFFEGIGVWKTSPPSTFTAFNWVEQGNGIEQLVINSICKLPGGPIVVGAWDRSVFISSDPDVFPSRHYVDNSFMACWGIDYASSDHDFLAAHCYWTSDKSCYSTDAGQTWAQFASDPAASNGGCIACSTPQNIVRVFSNNSYPYYTLNGGTSWTRCTIPAEPTTGETGWGFSFVVNRHIVASDRVLVNTFYLYNYRTGFYESTDGGVTWTRTRTSTIGVASGVAGFNAKMRSVPGQAGHLFFCAGSIGNFGDAHPANEPFYRSIDGGRNWTEIGNVKEVLCFGYGKPAVSYPTIYIMGWVSGVFGIWRSTDEASTWTKVGDFPLGNMDDPTWLEGDQDTFGLVYYGTRGSGCAYADTSKNRVRLTVTT
jgi:hypothetical protein